MNSQHVTFWSLLLLLCACGDPSGPVRNPADGVDSADAGYGEPGEPATATLSPGELQPGGETTALVEDALGAFVQPAANLGLRRRADFEAGVQLFRLAWVPAPGPGDLDGLGPNFHADSCLGCHARNGRGLADGSVGVLLRLANAQGSPDPTYGAQLQPRALPNLTAKGRASLSWARVRSITLPGDEVVTLRRPVYALEEMAAGPLASQTHISPRIAQQLVGMGLLEAVTQDELLSWEDPRDLDGDGISGRMARLDGGRAGRFGWKAAQPTVEAQTAAAFAGDLGITSHLFPDENCAPWQARCDALPNGGAPEILPERLRVTASYLRLLAVPGRRQGDAESVLKGKVIFATLGCDRCHRPTMTTGEALEPELASQRIWPYTDLLLHDMGPELSEGAAEADAQPQEWRTPPLWGLGLVPRVNGQLHLLHDGRAHSWQEAILWHGGEGQQAARAYQQISALDRQRLHQFLMSL